MVKVNITVLFNSNSLNFSDTHFLWSDHALVEWR